MREKNGAGWVAVTGVLNNQRPQPFEATLLLFLLFCISVPLSVSCILNRREQLPMKVLFRNERLLCWTGAMLRGEERTTSQVGFLRHPFHSGVMHVEGAATSLANVEYY